MSEEAQEKKPGRIKILSHIPGFQKKTFANHWRHSNVDHYPTSLTLKDYQIPTFE